MHEVIASFAPSSQSIETSGRPMLRRNVENKDPNYCAFHRITTTGITFCDASKSSLYVVIFVGKAKKPLATQKFIAKYRGEICVGKDDFSDAFHERRRQMYSFSTLPKRR